MAEASGLVTVVEPSRAGRACAAVVSVVPAANFVPALVVVNRRCRAQVESVPVQLVLVEERVGSS